ncbi:hypothetical protein ES702_05928 [subsurface metagenome]
MAVEVEVVVVDLEIVVAVAVEVASQLTVEVLVTSPAESRPSTKSIHANSFTINNERQLRYDGTLCTRAYDFGR